MNDDNSGTRFRARDVGDFWPRVLLSPILGALVVNLSGLLDHTRQCRKINRSFCCFNSLLSRIINQQGRPQLGKDWGFDPRTPDCSGFTVTELQRLDFGAMDFSEFYASIVPKLPDASAIGRNAAGRAPNCYYGQGACQ